MNKALLPKIETCLVYLQAHQGKQIAIRSFISDTPPNDDRHFSTHLQFHFPYETALARLSGNRLMILNQGFLFEVGLDFVEEIKLNFPTIEILENYGSCYRHSFLEVEEEGVEV
jgi:hypothetical protein